MKKLFALSLLFALGAASYAEEIQFISLTDGFPQPQDPPFLGLTISPNGKYVAGALDMGVGIFIADRETGKVVWAICEDENGGELRDVDNNGLAIGVEDSGILYSFDTEKITPIAAPKGSRGLIGEGLTNDGSMMIASLTSQSFETRAAFKKEDGAWTNLPMPTDEEAGDYLDRYIDASSAKFVSADGKVIYGCLGSFTVPTAWIRNDAGEYESDFFPARFVNLANPDVNDPEKPLLSVSAMYGMNMSNNGKYLVMLAWTKNKENETMIVPAVYNTETKEMKVYDDAQPIDATGVGLWPTAIADDGTIIGCVGQPYWGAKCSFIIEAGQTVAKSFNDAFPKYADKLGEAEILGFNMPTGISADGRYIMGYTYYCEDYNDPAAYDYYVTYVIDRGENAAVNAISSEEATPVTEAIYTLDGQRITNLTKGINIIRMSDGSSRKVMVK